MKRPRVLIVDDEADFRTIMCERIKSWGYEAVSVSSGKKAIDLIEKKKPDLTILDYMMPEMDGITTLKKIRKINKKIPVIMFTAYPHAKAIEKSERLGVRAFIPKLSAYSDAQTTLKIAVDMALKSKNGVNSIFYEKGKRKK